MLYWRKNKQNNCHKIHPPTPTPYFYRFPQYTSLYYRQKEKAFSTPILFMNIKMQSVQYSIQSIHISMQIFVWWPYWALYFRTWIICKFMKFYLVNIERTHYYWLWFLSTAFYFNPENARSYALQQHLSNLWRVFHSVVWMMYGTICDPQKIIYHQIMA